MKSARDQAAQQLKAARDELQRAQAVSTNHETALKAARDEAAQLQKAVNDAQAAMKELNALMASERSARVAAERALAEARRPAQ